METFPDNPPRKQIDIPFFLTKTRELDTIRTTGVEVTPFIIHRKWDHESNKAVKKGLWQVTHLFTGMGLGVAGSYRFCKAVAEAIMAEPLVWLPCQTMWNGHPDIERVSQKLQNIKAKHENLGRWS